MYLTQARHFGYSNPWLRRGRANPGFISRRRGVALPEMLTRRPGKGEQEA